MIERNKERRWDLSHCWHLLVVGNIYDNKELVEKDKLRM